MTTSHDTPSSFDSSQVIWVAREVMFNQATVSPQRSFQQRLDPLQPIRHWLDELDVRTPELAQLICQLIPANCPFERTVKLLGRTLFRIPPLCKLNPLYEQLVGLRFRALCYLADECGEDVSRYC